LLDYNRRLKDTIIIRLLDLTCGEFKIGASGLGGVKQGLAARSYLCAARFYLGDV
jgi:hypothetical protein